MHIFATRNGLHATQAVEILKWCEENLGDRLMRRDVKGQAGECWYKFEIDQCAGYANVGDGRLRDRVYLLEDEADLKAVLDTWGDSVVDLGMADIAPIARGEPSVLRM